MTNMSREELIKHIEELFPADESGEQHAKIGKRLLAQAKREVVGWEEEPIEVLRRYAELCTAEENRLCR